MLWSLAPAPVPAPVRIPWPASSAAPTYRPRPSSPSGSVACIWANTLRRCACRSASVCMCTCCLCDFHQWRGEPVPFLACRHAVQPVCACCEWPKLKVCFSSIFFLFLVNFVVALTAESGWRRAGCRLAIALLVRPYPAMVTGQSPYDHRPVTARDSSTPKSTSYGHRTVTVQRAFTQGRSP